MVKWTDRPDMTIAIDQDVNNLTKPKQAKWIFTKIQSGLKKIPSCARVCPAKDKQQKPTHQQEVNIKFEAWSTVV